MDMKSSRKAAILLLLIVFTLVPAFAENPVGSIQEIEGFVEIDAFGVGRPIGAVTGDPVYPSSVIITDFNSWATVIIDGATHVVSPRSTTRVSTFLVERRRRPAGFFRRLLDGVAKSLGAPEEEVADFGGRASEAPSDKGFDTMFFVDVDVDAEYKLGAEALAAARFREAVEHFSAIEFPEDGTFDVEQYYLDYTYALLGLGDFDAAVRTAFSYGYAEPSTRETEFLPDRLRLLVAIGAYYSGDDDLAFAAADAYVEALGMESADPQALGIRIRLARLQGVSDAAQWERRARAARPEIDWDALLAD
jgi:hypothetical protein